MSDFLLDQLNHDITFDAAGSLVFAELDVEVAQRVEIRLRTQILEWLFDQAMGLPWIPDERGNGILVKNPDLRTIQDLIVEETSKVETVREILRIDLDLSSDRTLRVEMDIVSIYGQTQTVII